MPQHYASWSGVLEAVVALLSAGANILARSGWVLAIAAQASAAYNYEFVQGRQGPMLGGQPAFDQDEGQHWISYSQLLRNILLDSCERTGDSGSAQQD